MQDFGFGDAGVIGLVLALFAQAAAIAWRGGALTERIQNIGEDLHTVVGDLKEIRESQDVRVTQLTEKVGRLEIQLAAFQGEMKTVRTEIAAVRDGG